MDVPKFWGRKREKFATDPPVIGRRKRASRLRPSVGPQKHPKQRKHEWEGWGWLIFTGRWASDKRSR